MQQTLVWRPQSKTTNRNTPAFASLGHAPTLSTTLSRKRLQLFSTPFFIGGVRERYQRGKQENNSADWLGSSDTFRGFFKGHAAGPPTDINRSSGLVGYSESCGLVGYSESCFTAPVMAWHWSTVEHCRLNCALLHQRGYHVSFSEVLFCYFIRNVLSCIQGTPAADFRRDLLLQCFFLVFGVFCSSEYALVFSALLGLFPLSLLVFLGNMIELLSSGVC